MSIKSDKWIRKMASEQAMIAPFAESQVRQHEGQRIISYGTSSYGYDIRCSANSRFSLILIPRLSIPNNLRRKVLWMCIVMFVSFRPTHLYLRAVWIYLKIPRNVLVVCLGKSTYARCGIIVNVTPLEPEWEGHITLEFSNTHAVASQDLCK